MAPFVLSCYSVDKAGVKSKSMIVTTGIGTDLQSRQWEDIHSYVVKWILSTGQPYNDGDRKLSGVMTLIFP